MEFSLKYGMTSYDEIHKVKILKINYYQNLDFSLSLEKLKKYLE